MESKKTLQNRIKRAKQFNTGLDGSECMLVQSICPCSFGGPLTHPRRYCRDRDVFLKDHLGQDGSEGQDNEEGEDGDIYGNISR